MDLIYEDEEGEGLSGTARQSLEVLELGDARPRRLEHAFSFALAGLQKILGVRLDLEGKQGDAIEQRIRLASDIPVVGGLVAEVSIAGKRLQDAGRIFARPVLAAYVNVLGAFSQITPERRIALAQAAEAHLAAP